jgi:hypothetical protein
VKPVTRHRGFFAATGGATSIEDDPMVRKSASASSDLLIGTLLRAREQAIHQNETMAAYLIGMAIKVIEDRQAEGVPPGWDDGVVEEDGDTAQAGLPAA